MPFHACARLKPTDKACTVQHRNEDKEAIEDTAGNEYINNNTTQCLSHFSD